jgi:aconitase A
MSAVMDFKQSFSHGSFYSLPEVERQGFGKVSRLPVSLRIILESLVRNLDGKRIREQDVRALASWQPKAERKEEIPFIVSRWWSISPPCAPRWASRDGRRD